MVPPMKTDRQKKRDDRKRGYRKGRDIIGSRGNVFLSVVFLSTDSGGRGFDHLSQWFVVDLTGTPNHNAIDLPEGV